MIMFEISGDDVTQLSDDDLRSVVARLAIAELRAKGIPLSSVTAGGNQDAPDGGLDVRVECPMEIANPDFVARSLTGFQVKKPDMPASAIKEEMRPNGILRKVIADLASSSGSYIIVSSQGSVADKPLADRRAAMRSALMDVPNGDFLHTDFYDRNRLATWINEYPGVGTWVLRRVGRPLFGWSCIDDWEGRNDDIPKPYLVSDTACLIDERSCEHKSLTIMEGIKHLRDGLAATKQCIRLIGLSGIGKTRLVQALFEDAVGDNSLDSSSAIYTDYSEETNPTAREMARELIAQQQRAILIVDNCNPATHSELALLCSSERSNVSLITVEYDVRDDEPERTDVFRLNAASPEIVSEWLKLSFPFVSQVDRNRIAEFSGGNFRVSRALADTLAKGETLGRLKSNELFERIFLQRKTSDRELLLAAEDLSLLYSIDGQDDSDGGELALVGSIRGVEAQFLFEALIEMSKRGVVQSRGRYRALLPQAIANPLAASALERIPPNRFDQFCVSLPPRMLRSVSRRIGYLHDSNAARATVDRWMRLDGPFGNLFSFGTDGFQIIANIAPVLPGLLLEKLEQEVDQHSGDTSATTLHSQRTQWVRLIKAIGYEAMFFDRTVTLLAKFLPLNTENSNGDIALKSFEELFHIYLSGTQAKPDQRREIIRRLQISKDKSSRHAAKVAMRAIIATGQFISTSNYSFGARSRGYGWHPATNGDIWDWFESAIELVLEIATERDARVLLADNFRGLWRYPRCREAIDRAATKFMKSQPWVEGWLASRSTLRFDGKDMSLEASTKLEALVTRLKPSDLLNKARAVILNRMLGVGGWDYSDGECDDDEGSRSWDKADRMAEEIGRSLASDSVVRAEFLPEVVAAPQAIRAYLCGSGLAEAAADLGSIWDEIVTCYQSSKVEIRDATILRGFLHGACKIDSVFTSEALGFVSSDALLASKLPYLQAGVGIDAEGIERLRKALKTGLLAALDFRVIANGSVKDSPPEQLAELLVDIATLPHGVEVSLDILQMHFYCVKKTKLPRHKQLIAVGRDLLSRLDFSRQNDLRDFSVGEVIADCIEGYGGEQIAKMICENIRGGLENYSVSNFNLNHTLLKLFELQPTVALDTFLLPTVVRHDVSPFLDRFWRKSPLAVLESSTLVAWADQEPNLRYKALGESLPLFTEEAVDGSCISVLFLSVLEAAPDKRLFLGEVNNRLYPDSWSGSFTQFLLRRKEALLKLGDLDHEEVRTWVSAAQLWLDVEIEQGRDRESAGEQSFE